MAALIREKTALLPSSVSGYFSANSLKVGETVTVEGAQARSGVNGVNADIVLKADGQRVYGGEAQ